jgi:hypothetical protein
MRQARTSVRPQRRTSGAISRALPVAPTHCSCLPPPKVGQHVPELRPRFAWQDAEGAASYPCHLAGDRRFAAPLVDRPALATSEVLLP